MFRALKPTYQPARGRKPYKARWKEGDAQKEKGKWFVTEQEALAFTERFETFVFGALNERFEDGKPVLLTTNFTGETLATRFVDPEKAVPLMERLREFCLPVCFTHSPL